MKSRGYCTSNKDGLFEVNYILQDGLFSKLFNLKREFRFTCPAINKNNYKLYLNCYTDFEWFNEDGDKVTKRSQLKKIDFVLTESIVVEDHFDILYNS